MESEETTGKSVKRISAEIEIQVTPDPKEEAAKRKCDKRANICLLAIFFLFLIGIIGIINEWVLFVAACMWVSIIPVLGFVYYTFWHKSRKGGVNDRDFVDKYGYL